MRGVVLASVSFLALVGLCAGGLRFYSGRKYFKIFLVAFAVAAAVYALLYRALPDDLGVLPVGWLEPNGTVDFLNGILILVLLFHSFWDAVYTTALTGFSGNLIVLLHRHGGLSRDQLLEIYGAREEIDRVLAWRLPNLLEGGYLRAEGAGYRLRPKGWLIGRVTRWLKLLLTAHDTSG